MVEKRRPVALIIMDGYALNPSSKGNAVTLAETPTLDALFKSAPWTTLTSFGPRVGLPEGQMGNSEVGHLNIGGGRIVQQELTRINGAVMRGEIVSLPAFSRACQAVCAKPEAALHLIGLVSTGGVHSALEHLEALIQAALKLEVPRVYIHAITDGRDRPPTASVEELGALEEFIHRQRGAFPSAELGISSIIGRYYAMDRDKRWERTELAYNLLTDEDRLDGPVLAFTDPLAAIKREHEKGITDEFITAHAAARNCFKRSPVVMDGDAVLFFNFRADRMRQIVSAFLGERVGFDGFERKQTPSLSHLLSLTEYDAKLPTEQLFAPMAVKNHLGLAIAHAGLTQLRIAETEKYAHVTYFFSGGEEEPAPGEQRIMIPSPRDVATYDLKPEMSADKVNAALIEAIAASKADVYIVNFANCDMVGHTGSLPAAIKAVETVDRCLGTLLQALHAQNGIALVTADHGNADQMIDYETGAPHTFHTLHPVPLILVGGPTDAKLRSGGALCDIAPTICELLAIDVPAEMTGRSLLEHQ